MSVRSVACISDVPLGYGSSQIPALLRSLEEHYEGPRVTVIEPRVPEKPSLPHLFTRWTIHSVETGFHPHSQAGRIEYVLQASRKVRELEPDFLVLCTGFTLPVALQLARRPRFTLYYALEMSNLYGEDEAITHRRALPLVDLVIFPEENRAALEIEHWGGIRSPFVILYNCSEMDSAEDRVLDSTARNGRLIYAGTIAERLTFPEYFLDRVMQEKPIDLFGFVVGPNGEQLEKRLRSMEGNVRYKGPVDHRTLKKIRKQYAFSLVAWNPITIQNYYACPHKFFEAIADGVPPIAAPHPQCAKLIRRYRCGILMEDWSLSSFLEAIETALRLYGTSDYEWMVEKCRQATERELNWVIQFAKLRPYLPEG